MSFAPSYRPSEYSFQCSRKSSKKAIDRNDPMRLLFPGGWDNKDSDVFRWYDSQPQKHFRKLQYYKERQGVEHELIVLPLQNVNGSPTSRFCRLERMADPRQQLAAITADGTEASDYIQAFDDDLLGVTRGATILTEIVFPRNIDLYDVLAICSAIFEHPQARRYTLQQFNCYFFSWVIILSLVRRQANWESLVSPLWHTIKPTILAQVASPADTEWHKSAYTLSRVHDSRKRPSPSLLYDTLCSELSSLEFQELANVALRSVLWVNRGQAELKTALSNGSMTLAEKTLGIFMDGTELDPDVILGTSFKGAIDLVPERDIREHALRGAAITWTYWPAIIVRYHKEAMQRMKNRQQKNHGGLSKNRSSNSHSAFVSKFRLFTVHLAEGLLLPVLGLLHAASIAELHDKIAKHQRQAKGFRALKYAARTVRHFPQCLLTLTRIYLSFEVMLKDEYTEENGLWEDVLLRAASHALDLTVADLLERLPDWNGDMFRAVILQLVGIFSGEFPWLHMMSPKQLWNHLLWDFLGDIIVKTMLKAIITKRSDEIKFECFQPSKIKEPLIEDTTFELTPIVKIQQFIEERIVRLSKHDIERAPIIQHIPLPAMPPSYKSQQQIKDALGEIWRTVNLGNRFRG